MSETTPARPAINWMRLVTRQFLWLPLIPLVTAAVLAGFAIAEGRRAERLAVFGIDTIATVTGNETRRVGSGDDERTEYRLRLRFQPPTGPAVETWTVVGQPTYRQLPPGTETPLRYLQHDPEVFEIEPEATATAARILGWTALGLAFVALALAALLARRLRSLLRAVRHGAVVQARVEAIETLPGGKNDTPRYRLRWVDALGNVGRSEPHPFAALPGVGSVIVVHIDPRTGRGWWTGDFRPGAPAA